jgi:hypothetical protein
MTIATIHFAHSVRSVVATRRKTKDTRRKTQEARQSKKEKEISETGDQGAGYQDSRISGL